MKLNMSEFCYSFCKWNDKVMSVVHCSGLGWNGTVNRLNLKIAILTLTWASFRRKKEVLFLCRQCYSCFGLFSFAEALDSQPAQNVNHFPGRDTSFSSHVPLTLCPSLLPQRSLTIQLGRIYGWCLYNVAIVLSQPSQCVNIVERTFSTI